MESQSKKTKPKLVLIGLDSFTFDLLDPLMEQGELPHIASLIQSGARGVLRSCYLPLSPPAWTSITTAR